MRLKCVYHCATTSLVKKFGIIEFIMYDRDKNNTWIMMKNT
jgi:hypothetical protein